MKNIHLSFRNWRGLVPPMMLRVSLKPPFGSGFRSAAPGLGQRPVLKNWLIAVGPLMLNDIWPYPDQ
jgi:hypothetical protein